MVDPIENGNDLERAATQSSAAPENQSIPQQFHLLMEAGLTLEPLKLPTVQVEGGQVVFSNMTLDTLTAHPYPSAFAKLTAQGCDVTIDPYAAQDFVSYRISAPESLFPAAVVRDINASIAARAAQAGKSKHTTGFDPSNLEVGC